MTEPLGRADLHIHTLASDGTAGAVEILEHVERNTELDVIAITDHERIDAALAGRAIARDRGLRFEVVVGEEVTTLGGHLLALWLERPVKPFRTMRTTIAEVHDRGGIAIPAHPHGWSRRAGSAGTNIGHASSGSRCLSAGRGVSA